MLRKALLVSALAAWSLALGGCHLYFEDDDRNGDGYTYCDETGCYWCDDWGCYPSDGGDGGVGPGWDCSNNAECAAGCFCNADGVCEEAGFCTVSEDCPDGYVCDDRSSCVPEGSEDGCQVDTECPTGNVCNEDTGVCEHSGTCDEQSDCDDGETCDTERGTCVPEPPITCQGAVTCDAAAPVCPSGSTPAIQNGCYTGECMPKAECPDGAPFACSDLDGDEQACFEHAECSPIYTGINCTDPEGNQCTDGAANCTCESFRYDHCAANE